MQIVGPKRIGQLLRPCKIINTNEGVVSRCIADTLRSKFTSQPGMAVTIELQAERAQGRHA